MASSQTSRLPGARNGKSRPISLYGNDILTPTAEGSTTSKQAKRRSLLPQFTRKFSEELAGSETIAEDGAEAVEEAPSAPTAAETTRVDRTAMPPPPKPMRPTTKMLAPSPVGRSNSVRSHARSSSKEVSLHPEPSGAASRQPLSAASRLDSGIKRTSSIRMPQSPSKARHGPTPSLSQPASSRTRTGSTTSNTSSATDKRSSVNLGRPPNINTTLTYNGIGQVSPTSPTSSTTSRQSATRSQAPSLARPAFTTYQQHYSPAKSALPKPPLPSAKSIKKLELVEEPDIAMTLDVIKEQVELLQLSILHQDALSATSHFEASAKRQLSRQHARLKRDLDSISASEAERRTLENLAAVEAWCPDAALLAEHIHTISRVVSDLRTFTDSGSRYAVLTTQFEEWIAKAETSLFGNTASSSAQPLDPLPDLWRATHTSLALKLRAIQREMATLPPAPVLEDSQSSLEALLETCAALIDGMLKGLEVMTKLQKEVVQQEQARVDARVMALTHSAEQQRQAGLDKENWAPAWS